ncbi:MAG: UDP-N-acetylmuramoyl-tripeptide--D-alanyl-D-alanine ligase [Bacteroidales bacterium]|jgi:UDP-N-acetylmuramoyl-tripeptide--D-alanyl-D-alanine ligase|nr:UDP-N-acetylmuramoyl-tripeptide--D-alanyl-D-alanine ligase [Bacteroidales bacterium]
MDIESLYRLYRRSAGVTTDSRTIRKGEIFFALRGPTHDGNRHAAAAIDAGALAAVVDDPSLDGEGIVVVRDVLETMAALAASHRLRLKMPVIAITGTNGKTTTKELVTAVLSRKGKVHSTAGNFNNHIGVPLTLLSAPDDVSFLVVEMGANHMGEIDALCRIAMPTHGLITNIGRAHIEGFGSFENVRKAKSELYRWLGANGGTVIYNDENNVLSGLVAGMARAVPYSEPGSHSLSAGPDDDEGMVLRVSATIDGVVHRFETGLFGRYNIDNVRAAMAAGLLFDVPVSGIIDAVSSYRPSNNRSQVTQTGKNTVIRDAYNANPSSMEKAISSFAGLKAEKKMVILGDMLELGSESRPGHEAVIRQLISLPGIRAVLVGPLFREAAAAFQSEQLLAAGTPGGLQAEFFPTSEEAAEWLKAENPQGYTILVKGSRGIMLEKVFPSL